MLLPLKSSSSDKTNNPLLTNLQKRIESLHMIEKAIADLRVMHSAELQRILELLARAAENRPVRQ